jgi:hypothetical protein
MTTSATAALLPAADTHTNGQWLDGPNGGYNGGGRRKNEWWLRFYEEGGRAEEHGGRDQGKGGGLSMRFISTPPPTMGMVNGYDNSRQPSMEEEHEKTKKRLREGGREDCDQWMKLEIISRCWTFGRK